MRFLDAPIVKTMCKNSVKTPEEYMSHKSRIVSFWAMVAVTLIHSNTIGTFPEASGWNVFAQTLFTRALTSWAVPAFFLTSGYWHATKSSTRASCVRGAAALLKKKCKSLVLPYFL